MAYLDLRLFPNPDGDNKILNPTEFSWQACITEDTSALIQYTATRVCTTCDFSDLWEWNGVRWIYISCQHPNSPYGARPHNALQWCDKHTK